MVADQVEEDADQPVLVALDQGFEGPRDVVAHLEHQPDVRVARLQLLFQGLSLSVHRASSRSRATLDRSIIFAYRVCVRSSTTSRRRSWPQAASIARPLVLRTVTLTPRPRRIVDEPVDRLGIGPLEGQARHGVVRDQVDVDLASRQQPAPVPGIRAADRSPRRSSTYS